MKSYKRLTRGSCSSGSALCMEKYQQKGSLEDFKSQIPHCLHVLCSVRVMTTSVTKIFWLLCSTKLRLWCLLLFPGFAGQ